MEKRGGVLAEVEKRGGVLAELEKRGGVVYPDYLSVGVELD